MTTVETTETQKSQVQVADEQAAEKNLVDPYVFLATYPNAPTKATVEALKSQAPNGIIRLFVLGKRVFLVRGISGLELSVVQSQIPANLGAGLSPEAQAEKLEKEIAIATSSKCVVWTSMTQDGKLTADQLRAGSAGLPSTLFQLVTYLSDFIDPEAFNVLSTEL